MHRWKQPIVYAEVTESTSAELIEVLHDQPKESFRLSRLPEYAGFQKYEQALPHALNRTPEEIAAVRARVLQNSPRPRELPEGKTLEDVVMGQWPGDETDEQIFKALEKLSQ